MRSYVKALEERVAELETSLYSGGQVEASNDHWKAGEPQPAVDYWDRESEDIAVDSLSAAVRDLSLNACGFYVGGRSNFTLGRLLASVLHDYPRKVGSFPPDLRENFVTDDSIHHSGNPSDSGDGRNKSDALFGRSGADEVFGAYMKYIAVRYPILPSILLSRLHQNRQKLENPFDISVLHLVYAIGERSLELAGQSHCASLPEEHYEAAMSRREVIMQYADRRSIAYLALASIYCLRAPRTPGPWIIIGHAMKLCISLGLHKKSNKGIISYHHELDQRLFWSCYCLDVDATIASGSPPSITNRDIDAALPLDVDEANTSFQALHAAAVCQQSNAPTRTPTTLTWSILEIKMKRIIASIQHEIYRVDTDVSPSRELINDLLEALEKWKAEATSQSSAATQNQSLGGWLIGPNARLVLNHLHNIQYCAGVRLLLFPQLAEATVYRPYIERCATACISIISSYIQCLFLSGLTLIYCLSLAPGIKPRSIVQNALMDCTIILYVMSERWHEGKRYWDAFEHIKTVTDDMMSHNEPTSRGDGPVVRTERHSNADTSVQKPETAAQSFSGMLNDIIACPDGTGNEHAFGRVLNYEPSTNACQADDIYDFDMIQRVDAPVFAPDSMAETGTSRPNRPLFAFQQELSAFQSDPFGTAEGFDPELPVEADSEWFYSSSH